MPTSRKPTNSYHNEYTYRKRACSDCSYQMLLPLQTTHQLVAVEFVVLRTRQIRCSVEVVAACSAVQRRLRRQTGPFLLCQLSLGWCCHQRLQNRLCQFVSC